MQNNDGIKHVLRLSRSTAERMQVLAGKAWQGGYRFCYGTGVQTLRFLKYTGKRLHKILAPVGRCLYKAADFILIRHIVSIGRECKRLGAGFVLAARRLKAAWNRHPALVIPQALLLPFLAIRRHRKALASILNLAAPVAAAFVMMTTVNYWSNLTFALSLEYDGEQMGFIADESVFDKALSLASARVINTDNSFEMQRTPKLTVAVASKDAILDEKALAEKILLTSGDSIAEVSGLYIDGEFKGAVQSRDQLEALLNTIKNKYLTGEEGETAEFLQDIQIVDKLYPITAVVSMKEMDELLNAQTIVPRYYEVVKGDTLGRIASRNDMTLNELKALNPDIDEMIHIGDEILLQQPKSYLQVVVKRTIQYTEEIPFETEKEKDDSKYTTYQKVTQKGQKGSREVVAEVVSIDGVEDSRVVLSETVTQEPVTQKMIVGTKKQVSVSGTEIKQGDGVITGNFVWPLPVCTNVHQKYHSGHRAWDISSGPVGVFNQPIIAADGGEVVYAGRNGAYGLLVKIRHANGLETWYAHCNRLDVVVGQKVSRGQQIALAGSTGNSTGPHLHFEVRLNGVSQNPAKYLTPGSYR